MASTLRQGGREFAAGGDAQLGVGMGEVDLDGAGVTNSAWAISRLARPVAAISATRRSLAVRASIPLCHKPARSGPGGTQLDQSTLGQRPGTAAVREVQTGGQRTTSVDTPAAAADGRAEVQQRADMLQPRQRSTQHAHRLAKQLLPRRTPVGLVKTSELPHVVLRALPFEAGAHPDVDGSFTVLEFPDPGDPRIVSLDWRTDSDCLDGLRAVAAHRHDHERLRAGRAAPE